MRLVSRWLLYQRAPADEFFMECINFIDMHVSEVAVVNRHRRPDGIWTMPNHDAYVPTRKKLPPFHGGSVRGKGSPGEGAEFTLTFSQINLTAVTAEKTMWASAVRRSPGEPAR